MNAFASTIMVWMIGLSTAIFLAGCGGDDNGGTGVEATATAQLGNLADATVTIYRIEEDGSRTMLWQEKTAAGKELAQIGTFTSHMEELEPQKLYLYEVEGGEDWDADDDGVIDAAPTPNKGKIRAIATTESIQAAASQFRITQASETMFEKMLGDLLYRYDPRGFPWIMEEKVADILTKDLNDDGKIDMKDLLIYDPTKDREALSLYYKASVDRFIQTIHAGGEPLFELSSMQNLQLGDYCEKVVRSEDGRTLYTVDYYGLLQVVNISSLGLFNVEGTLEIGGVPSTLYLAPSGETLYIGEEDKGITIVDVRNSAMPQKVGFIEIDGRITDLALSADENWLYVANGEKGLRIVDVNARSVTDTLPFQDNAFRLARTKEGTILYATDGNAGIYVFDLSQPSMPRTLKTLEFKAGVRDMALSRPGNRMAVSDQNGTLWIMGIYGPTDIPILGVGGTLRTTDTLAISDDEAYVYVGEAGGTIETITISNPTRPWSVGLVQLEGLVNDIVPMSDGKSAVVVDRGYGVKLWDTTGSDNIAILNRIETEGEAKNLIVSQDEKYLYVADGWNGLLIYEVSNGSASLPTTFKVEGDVLNLALSKDGKRVFLAERYNEIDVVNITDPKSPFLETTIETSGDNISLTLSEDGTKLFVAEGYKGVEIFDVSTDTPTLLGKIETQSRVQDIAVDSKNERVFVTLGADGIGVWNFHDPTQPVLLELLSKVGGLSWVHSLAFSPDRSRLYAGGAGVDEDAVVVLNTQDIRKTEISGEIDFSGAILNLLYGSDNKLYIAAGFDGLIVLDVSNADQPRIVGRTRSTGDSVGLALSPGESLLYVAAEDIGISVVGTKIFSDTAY